MWRNNRFNIILFKLFDLKQDFIQESSSEVTGKNRKDEFWLIECSQLFWDDFTKFFYFFTFEVSFIILIDFLDLILTEAIHNFGGDFVSDLWDK